MNVPSVRRRATAKAPRRRAKIIRMPVSEAVRLQRRKRLRSLLAVAITLGMIAVWDHLEGSSAESHELNLRFRPNAIELALLDRVNAARQRAGRRPLVFSAALMRAAYFHSSDMAGADYLAVDSPLGRYSGGPHRRRGAGLSRIG